MPKYVIEINDSDRDMIVSSLEFASTYAIEANLHADSLRNRILAVDPVQPESKPDERKTDG